MFLAKLVSWQSPRGFAKAVMSVGFSDALTA
jgi:hypothetical protein